MTTHKAETTAMLDFSQLRCPQLLVEIKLLLRKMKSDDQVTIMVNDAAVISDLERLSEKLGFGLEYQKADSQPILIKLFAQTEPMPKVLKS